MREIKSTLKDVPSSDINDLFFNSGKVDEFVTSLQHSYTDRFGKCHRTVEGMNWVVDQLIEKFKIDANQAIIAVGYITLDSFQQGADLPNNELTQRNHILRDEATGEYYRWDGDLPKQVPSGSTPQSTGGIGKGAWISVGTASVKDELEKGEYRTSATSIYYVPNIIVDTITNNRNAIYAYGKDVYIPLNTTIRCNLLPADDVTIFKGEGKILTQDPWGNEHIFDVAKANKGSDFTVTNRVHQSCKVDVTKHISIGVVGDSITDGAYGKADWEPNPVGGAPERNLSSTNYNHSLGGGSMSWLAHFGYLMDEVLRRFSSSRCRYYNAASSGKKLSDGWAYRNFDYGFFQNAAYGNKAPDICLLSMGWNDSEENDFLSYKKEFDKFIRKAWGYGCTVGLVTVNTNEASRAAQESAVKSGLAELYRSVEYFDLSKDLRKFVDTDIRFQKEVYINQDGTIDITHPQALGHAAIAGSMIKQLFHKTFIPTLAAGQVLGLINADKYWYVSGASSRSPYKIRKVRLDRSEQLKEIGILAKSDIAAENVNLTTYIWCDDDNSELILIETRATDFTTNSRNHLINVRAPAGMDVPSAYQTMVSNGFIASSYLGDNKVLSTDVCKLRYGLNRVVIAYDGKPNQVYIPLLKVNKRSELGAKFDRKVVVRRGTEPQELFSANPNFADNITSGLYDGSSFAKLPDWYCSSGSDTAAVTVHGGIKQDGAAIISNFNKFELTGIVVKRVGTVLHVSKMEGGSLVETYETTLDGASTFSVYVNQTQGQVKGLSVRVVDSSEREYSKSFGGVGGGKVACFTADDSTNVVFTVSFTAYKIS